MASYHLFCKELIGGLQSTSGLCFVILDIAKFFHTRYLIAIVLASDSFCSISELQKNLRGMLWDR